MRSEKRRNPRKSLRYNAWVSAPGGKPVGCVVSDISETGARLEVEEPEGLPERLLLLLTGDGRARRACRVVWRAEHQVGVQFEKPSDLHAPANSDAAPA